MEIVRRCPSHRCCQNSRVGMGRRSEHRCGEVRKSGVDGMCMCAMMAVIVFYVRCCSDVGSRRWRWRQVVSAAGVGTWTWAAERHRDFCQRQAAAVMAALNRECTIQHRLLHEVLWRSTAASWIVSLNSTILTQFFHSLAQSQSCQSVWPKLVVDRWGSFHCVDSRCVLTLYSITLFSCSARLPSSDRHILL